jgi:predicted nuclease of predicted toxin-antitoxin system
MRLLLDENLPNRLKEDFPEHEIFTVRDKGWNGIKNGALLKLMLEENFDALLTFDKNLRYQQNFTKYFIAVFVLTASNNTYIVLKESVSDIKKYLSSEKLKPGVIIIPHERHRGT